MAKATFRFHIADLTPLALFIACWELLAFFSGNQYFPHIPAIFQLLWNSFNFDPKINSIGASAGFKTHVLTTAFYYIPGCFIGIILGIRGSLLLFANKKAFRVLEPIFEFTRIIPPLIIVPFLILAFKGSAFIKLLVIIMYTTLSVGVFGIISLQNISQNYIDNAIILGASKRQLINRVLRPAMLPGIIGGIRVNIAMSLGVLIVAENIGGYDGIGKVLKVMQGFADVKYVLVSILWSVLLVTLFDLAMNYILQREIRWVRSSISVFDFFS